MVPINSDIIVCTVVSGLGVPYRTPHLYEAENCVDHRSIVVTIEVMGIITGQFWFVVGQGTDLLLNLADRGIPVLFPRITRFSLFDEHPIGGGWPWDVSADWTCQHNLFLFFECPKFKVVP